MNLIHVPLSQLVISPNNVRKTGTGDIAALAASMNDHAATPLDRLIAALARKAVAEHFARAAEQDDQKRDARSQEQSAQREAAYLAARACERPNERRVNTHYLESDMQGKQGIMQGKRVELIPQPGGFQLLNPGEYGQWTDGTWSASTPNGHGANLSHHDVTEHEDGTISVTPSILVSVRDVPLWHGYLTRGIWREC